MSEQKELDCRRSKKWGEIAMLSLQERTDWEEFLAMMASSDSDAFIRWVVAHPALFDCIIYTIRQSSDIPVMTRVDCSDALAQLQSLRNQLDDALDALDPSAIARADDSIRAWQSRHYPYPWKMWKEYIR